MIQLGREGNRQISKLAANDKENIITYSLQSGNEIKIKVKHIIVSALIDTGASISCLSEITYQQLIQQKILIKVMEINHKTCALADDTEVVVNRLAIIPFNIKGTEIQVKLHILPMNHLQIILGCDLLSLLNASISYINKEITFTINNANITQL